jgi:hypothetical protein
MSTGGFTRLLAQEDGIPGRKPIWILITALEPSCSGGIAPIRPMAAFLYPIK